MNTESLKLSTPTELKALLSANKISIRDIAEKISMSHPVVSDVINKKYKGSDATTEKVYEQIAKMLTHREDLSDDIYNYAPMYCRLLNIGIKHKSFNNDETAELIKLAKKINNFINQQSQSNA